MKESLIYPGEYAPPDNAELLLQELILSEKEIKGNIPPKINLEEHDVYYKLEISMPGIKRSEIVVYIHDNILSLAGKQREYLCEEAKKIKIHEFDNPCFQRHIFLPRNADATFISAEFRKGILHIHIPKTNEPLFLKKRQVIVY